MLGTTVSVMSVSALALQGAVLDGAVLTALVQALSSALLMNIAIVGLNQLFDVDIDKVNKPYLPLASGEFSMATGVALVAGSGAAALALGAASGSPPLMATLIASAALGVLYSTELPFMRWKRSPLLAAACILAVRALAVQLGFFFHMKWAIGAGAAVAVTPSLAFTVSFMLLFSIVIALFKDIPDVKGDEAANVRTFSVRFGQESIFWTCIWVLTAAYAGGIAYGVLCSATLASKAITILGHAALATALWWRAGAVNLRKRSDIADCYMHVWKLFYAEYLLIPFL